MRRQILILLLEMNEHHVIDFIPEKALNILKNTNPQSQYEALLNEVQTRLAEDFITQTQRDALSILESTLITAIHQ